MAFIGKKQEKISDITIKTSEPKETLPLIHEAVEREKRLINDSIRKTKANIKNLTAALGVSLKDFKEGKVKYTEDKEQSLLKLEGELNFLKRLEIRLKRLENLEICA
ncbi:MAG: hypothetical protein HY776_04390 [Actinobacteria bacterium]|nr:hypothetical protein [Actinomycetota bacterium]